MPPNVNEVESCITYTLRLIRRAAVLRRMAGNTSKKAQVRYKKDYDTHVQLNHALQQETVHSL